MTIEVVNETDVDIDVEALAAQARVQLDLLGLHPECELSVVIVDEDAMTELHVRWMDEPGPTDVLSFPMDELREPAEGEAPEPGVLGDIVLCPTVAERQAQKAGHSRDDELALLLTHGILHLLGYDHLEPEESVAMFALQGRILADWVASEAQR